MHFLHINESAAWCREHNAEVADPFTLLPDESLVERSRILFAPNGSLGLEPRVAQACLSAMGPWSSCLLWVKEWDIWPSGEDWPAFYALRGARDETASLFYKPGHLFAAEEHDALLSFLTIVLRNGWDAHLLPVSSGRLEPRFWISHDGWVELTSRTATSFLLTAG